MVVNYAGTSILVILAIVFFFLFTSFWGFYISIRPQKFLSVTTPKNFGLAYEDVSFLTVDGITLRGWLVPQKEQRQDAKTLILLHGYPADKGDILPPLIFLNKKYNLFLFDFRHLGQSGGKISTAGAREVEDLLAAIRFSESRRIKEVGVWGFSMGGAVALMAAEKTQAIKVLVSESSYARLGLMAPELYRIPGIRHFLGFLTGFWGKIFLGIDIRSVSPADAAKSLTIPILIIHSTNDDVIPFFNALLIKDALKNNPKAEFWFKENLFHGGLGEEYQQRIEDFFARNF